VLFKNKALHANTHPREVAMLFTIVAFCRKTNFVQRRQKM